MRANKKYLLIILILKSKWKQKIWNEEVAESTSRACQDSSDEADKARRKENGILFTTEEDQLEDEAPAENEVYPTAGSNKIVAERCIFG